MRHTAVPYGLVRRDARPPRGRRGWRTRGAAGLPAVPRPVLPRARVRRCLVVRVRSAAVGPSSNRTNANRTKNADPPRPQAAGAKGQSEMWEEVPSPRRCHSAARIRSPKITRRAAAATRRAVSVRASPGACGSLLGDRSARRTSCGGRCGRMRSGPRGGARRPASRSGASRRHKGARTLTANPRFTRLKCKTD